MTSLPLLKILRILKKIFRKIERLGNPTGKALKSVNIFVNKWIKTIREPRYERWYRLRGAGYLLKEIDVKD
jgi:hypothetical protein